SRLGFAEAKLSADKRLTVRLGTKPLVEGMPAEDFMIPQNRLIDYYSVKTADFAKELSLEVYRAVDLPAGAPAAPALRVKSAKCGKLDVPTKPVQAVVETTPDGRRLHVRVPLDARAVGSAWAFSVATTGIEIELEEAK